MRISWRGPFAVLSLVAVLGVAGCGGDDNDSSSTGTVAPTQAASTDGGGSDDSFCNQLRKIGDKLQDQADVSDPQQLSRLAGEVQDELGSVDPPEELQDAWGKLTDLFSTLRNLTENVDLTDPSSLEGLQDDLQQFEAQASELGSATTALSKYAADHCGGSFG